MRGKVVLGVAAGALAVAQLVPVERSNPPVEAEIPAPAPVREILERSCYDCHSHETRWPWYARIAPVSWLVAYDVRHAREHLNLSAWSRYDAKERREKLDELWEEVEEGAMPLWYYLPLHPQARLGDADKETLRAWTLAPAG
jgi:hypothetical protein